MREILFRGKAVKDDEYKKGSWIYGSLFINSVDDEVYIFDCGTNDKVLVNPETVGQCIGLEDYGGKYKVYEGDIVQDTNDAVLGVVYWDEDEASFMIEFDDCLIQATYINYYQTVGNKYDNPELLEQWERQKDDIEE